MADLIRTDGKIVKDVDISSLKKIQNHVGGYIGYYPVDAHSFMYMDEEGLLKDRDINPKASDIAGRIVVGDVLLCLNDEVDHE